MLGIFVGTIVLDDGAIEETRSSSPPFIALSVDGSSPTQTVEVHGDWTIEVRDPDGTLASQHTFTNDLTEDGARALAGLLAGTFFPGGFDGSGSKWSVYLVPGSGFGTVCDDPVPILGCVMRDIDGLSVSGPADRDDPGVLTLSGELIAESDGNITSVGTYLDGEYIDLVGPGGPFTRVDFFSDTKPVLAGQRVFAKVDLSFSSDFSAPSNGLAGLLAGNYSIRGSFVTLDSGTGGSPPCILDLGGTPVIQPCFIGESEGLTVSGPRDFSDPAVVVFEGSVVADQDGNLDFAAVTLSLDPTSVDTPLLGFGDNFDDQAVVAGQSIDFDFTIDFQ